MIRDNFNNIGRESNCTAGIIGLDGRVRFCISFEKQDSIQAYLANLDLYARNSTYVE